MTREQVYNSTLEYFNGNTLNTNVWIDKYCLKSGEDYLESSPDDMHRGLAKEFSRIEQKYPNPLSEEEIYQLLKDFNYIIPAGSILYGVRNNHSISSIGNCFVIGNDYDSIGAIFNIGEEQAQLMKRRAGVGHDLSNFRSKGTKVSNAANSSTGVETWEELYSFITRQIAQDGRRGALMLSLGINHPDSERFITSKDDLTKVTGANISVKVTDEFMETIGDYNLYNYNNKLWRKLIHQATTKAEPGVLFWDTITRESIPSCYGEEWKETSTNPCFHPDSYVETINGKVKIKDITSPTMVYSMDKYGKLCIKKASASFISRKNANTLKITLKNGTNITVTPEHKICVQNINGVPFGWMEAKNLKLGDRVNHLTRNRRGKRYSGVKLTSQYYRDYIMEHRLVWESINGKIPENFDIHHKDGNTFNNVINNLELLTHSKHSKHTALNDNPQTHQLRDYTGKFISPENKCSPKIENIPFELKTNLKNSSYNSIISIESGETTDVYDIQVEDTNCLLVNNIIAHNCGEIPLCPYDSCRLLSVNLYSFVEHPFTDKAFFNYDKFKDVVYKAQRLMDDVVDLEEEKINLILKKIENDPEPDEIKSVEKNLWIKIREKLLQGRRTGLSAIGLADCLASLNINYGSEESIALAEEIYKQFAISAYRSSIDMAEERGSFPIWNGDLEDNNPFLKRLLDYDFMYIDHNKYGRRNIALLTIPPSGTISMFGNKNGISSGIEPVYQLYYKRRRKLEKDNPNITFVDQNGDGWEEYIVLHPKFKEWSDRWLLDMEEKGQYVPYSLYSNYEFLSKLSPYKQSTAYEIDPLQRVKLQATIQKWIDHSISSTINLPEGTSEETVSNIYMEAWKQGCKGITVYVNNSRTGVLVDVEKKESEFKHHNAPKRPQVLPAEIYITKSKGTEWLVVIGLLNNLPYEIFAVENRWNIRDNYSVGVIIKERKGLYTLSIKDDLTIENFLENISDEENNLTRMISTALRHGADIKFIVEQLNKSRGDITTFSNAIKRILKKYIIDGASSEELCPECGSKLIYQNGCKECSRENNSECSYSKCG